MPEQKGVFEIRNGKCILDEEIILDYNDHIHNYSRVPLHRIAAGGSITLPELIVKNMNDQKRLDEDNQMGLLANHFLILDCIISNYLVHRSDPVNVVEIGCDNGSFSMHISSLLAEFAPKNDYVCVCNSIGNESGNMWLDHISQVKAPEGLQLVASNYSNTILKDNYFDLAVINGTVPIKDPVSVIKEAARITNDNGFILCFSNCQYLLDDAFQFMFAKRKEWRFSTEQVFYWVSKKDIWKMV